MALNANKLTSYPKEKIKILFLENISSIAVEKFAQAGYNNVKQVNAALSETALINEISKVHILGIRSKTHISPAILNAATKLQAIGCFCIGVNQVDLMAARHNGVAVFNAPYSNTRSVAELVIGASIMLMRKIPAKNKAAHEGIWLKEASGSYELRGKTIGIIGYGNIGTQVGILAESLGMKVIYYDVETKLPLGNANDSNGLKELLKTADIVTLHIPELNSTHKLIGKNELKLMKKTAILINYARGTVVDINALKEALTKNQIAGAAVDVFPEEPEKNGDLFITGLQNIDNVLLTPHIGGSTQEAQQNIGVDVTNKLLEYLEKGSSIGSHSIPALALPPQEGTHRILHIHRNVPGVLSRVNTLLSKNNINIEGQYLKTNEEVGYVVLDLDKNLSKDAVSLLGGLKDTIRLRKLY